MKIARNLLYAIGTLLIAMNALVIAVQFPKLMAEMNRRDDVAEKAGYAVGSVLFFLLGFGLLAIARRINKKIEKKRLQKEVQNFLS